ncbi:MAG: hypothetical protein JNK70_09760 [Phycisphaerae bacterium]|nr:hypothetical protein [Phycisphaerae bacterium]
MPRAILEIAVDNLRDADLARHAGADRLELARDLRRHGFTPDPRLVREVVAATGLPILAMARPGDGTDDRGPRAVTALLKDAERMLESGADGVVFGSITHGGEVDRQVTDGVVRLARGRATVFHRAFDLAPDPRDAVELLIDLGVTRILTSGHARNEAEAMFRGADDHAIPSPPAASTLDQRLARIRFIVEIARGRIEVLPCGGVRSHNADRFLLDTPARQLHSACRAPASPSLDPDEAARLRTAMDRASDAQHVRRGLGTVGSPACAQQAPHPPPRETP